MMKGEYYSDASMDHMALSHSLHSLSVWDKTLRKRERDRVKRTGKRNEGERCGFLHVASYIILAKSYTQKYI